MSQLMIDKNVNFGYSIQQSVTDISVILYAILMLAVVVLSVIICCGKKKTSTAEVQQETPPATSQHLASPGPSAEDHTHQLLSAQAIFSQDHKESSAPIKQLSMEKQQPVQKQVTVQKQATIQKHATIQKQTSVTPSNTTASKQTESTETYKKPVPKPICEGSKLGKLAKMDIKAANLKKAAVPHKVAQVDPKKTSLLPPPNPKSMSWPSLTPEHTYYGIPLTMEFKSVEIARKGAKWKKHA